MLTVVVFLPLAVALVLLVLPRVGDRSATWAWIATAAVDLGLVVALWWRYDAAAGQGGLAYETNLRWIPSVQSGYHVGVDGLSLPLLALTAGLFLACAVYSLRETHRVRAFAALFLFLETVSLGLFAALDLAIDPARGREMLELWNRDLGPEIHRVW